MDPRSVVPPDPIPVTDPPAGQDCITCKYGITRSYGVDPDVKVILECRYSDPSAQGSMGYWPQVMTTDWCGRWSAK